MATIDASLIFNICWIIGGFTYFFLFTTIIHFGCTQWMDPRLQIPKNSQKSKYFIFAHILRVINLLIAIADITFEQSADTVNNVNRRILGSSISCAVSSRIRTCLFLSSFYTYALFCWYKVAIVTIQSPQRNQIHDKYSNYQIQSNQTQNNQKRSRRRRNRGRKKKSGKKSTCLLLLRKEYWFLDLLWYYIQIVYFLTVIISNLTMSPSKDYQQVEKDGCSHNLNTNAILAYIIAVFIQFIALLYIFISPLWQLMKTKKRLFRERIRRVFHRSRNTSKNQNKMNINLHEESASSNISINKPQQQFISRIRGTICRNAVAGIISLLLFATFMTIYLYGRYADNVEFFTTGIGYVISYTCYLLNYLCLTFSYQNHWPMLLPLLCKPPWNKDRLSYASKISLQQSDNDGVLRIAVNDSLDGLTNIEGLLNKSRASMPIDIDNDNYNDGQQQRRRSKKSSGLDSSLESLLASSHMSTTPKYHTLKENDYDKMQKQYDEYVKKQQEFVKQKDTDKNNKYLQKTSDKYDYNTKIKQIYSGSLPPPQLKDKKIKGKNDNNVTNNDNDNQLVNDNNDKQTNNNNDDGNDDDDDGSESESESDYEDDDSDEEYSGSEDIDSIQLRVGSFDTINYKFSSIGMDNNIKL